MPTRDFRNKIADAYETVHALLLTNARHLLSAS